MKRLHLTPPRGACAPGDIMLGPWCLAKDSLVPGEPDTTCCVQDPYASVAEKKTASVSSYRLGLSLLPWLAEELNRLNGLDRSVEFWRLIAYPWLIHLVQAMWARRDRLRMAVDEHAHEPLTVTLAGEARWHYADTVDFVVNALFNHDFNHWLLSRMLEKNLPGAWRTETVPSPGKEERLPYLQPSPLESFSKGTRFLNIPGVEPSTCHEFSAILREAPHHQGERKKIAYPAPADPDTDLFKSVIMATLPDSLLDVADTLAEQKDMQPEPGKGWMVGSHIFFAEKEKVFLANRRDMGELIICSQHGCNYGLMACFEGFSSVEYWHDAFFSWGWESHEGHTRGVIPAPAPIFGMYSGKRRDPDGSLIMVGTRMTLYPERIKPAPQPLELFTFRRGMRSFFESLPQHILARAAYRPYFVEPNALEDGPYMTRHMPNLPLVSGDLNQRILSCSLLVMPTPGTTLHIALSADVPTICFWDKFLWPESREGAPVLDALRGAGLLHDTPEEAAAHVADIWEEGNDVESWWRSAPVRAARNTFCKRFARWDGDWKEQWTAILKNL